MKDLIELISDADGWIYEETLGNTQYLVHIDGRVLVFKKTKLQEVRHMPDLGIEAIINGFDLTDDDFYLPARNDLYMQKRYDGVVAYNLEVDAKPSNSLKAIRDQFEKSKTAEFSLTCQLDRLRIQLQDAKETCLSVEYSIEAGMTDMPSDPLSGTHPTIFERVWEFYNTLDNPKSVMLETEDIILQKNGKVIRKDKSGEWTLEQTAVDVVLVNMFLQGRESAIKRLKEHLTYARAGSGFRVPHELQNIQYIPEKKDAPQEEIDLKVDQPFTKGVFDRGMPQAPEELRRRLLL
ncbi:hypothetical protein FACS1894103_6930 [Campylobacterota bacterium]|nr:hypothetical protein FACS1894103_6930 [Campylobacterota bacterium]